jgi:hypothetical protein
MNFNLKKDLVSWRKRVFLPNQITTIIIIQEIIKNVKKNIFILILLDIEDEENKNKANDYIKLSEPNEQDNLFELIHKLNYNTNLNVLIRTINNIFKTCKRKQFDKKNLTLRLKPCELDKFQKKAKKVHEDFCVEILYSLLD